VGDLFGGNVSGVGANYILGVESIFRALTLIGLTC